MTRCGTCGGAGSTSFTCTCVYTTECYEPEVTGVTGYCVIVEGNGSLSTPIQFHSDIYPHDRPFNYITMETSGQAIGFSTAIDFDTELGIGDGGVVFDPGDPTKLTFQVDGIYLVGAWLGLTQGGVILDSANLRLSKNGSGTSLDTTLLMVTGLGADEVLGSLMTLVEFAQGDTLELVIGTSGNPTVNAPFGFPHASLWALWVGGPS